MKALFKPGNRYGSLNSYDVLKIIALLAMIVDHAGEYFFPAATGLRVVGRIAFPLFLFLVGYSGVWRFRADLLVYALAVTLIAALTRHPVFPLTILISIVFVRLCMPVLAARCSSAKQLAGIFLICAIWYPLTLWCDYGSLALLFALCGWQQATAPASMRTQYFLYVTTVLYFALQVLTFHLPVGSAIATLLLLALMAASLRTFRLQDVTVRLPQTLGHILRWTARNTLPLYAFHVMLFMLLEALLFPERLPHFQWIQ